MLSTDLDVWLAFVDWKADDLFDDWMVDSWRRGGVRVKGGLSDFMKEMRLGLSQSVVDYLDFKLYRSD